MKERGILFSAPMVRALLSGQKAQTRRLVKPQPTPWDANPAFLTWRGGEPATESMLVARCPYGVVGDRLWVRETWCSAWRTEDATSGTIFAADGVYVPGFDHPRGPHFNESNRPPLRFKPSIHLPRAASRITLEITSVRVERLQDISEYDSLAEGITGPHDVGYPAYRVPDDSKPRYSSARAAFESLWESINAERAPWASNPWVWVVEFARRP